MNAEYSFLAWVRQGLSGAGLPPDSVTGDLPARTELPIELTINENAPVPNPVRIAGPADVLGIDPRQVVRCNPAPFTRNFEPNFLAAIEFDRPDFPWMFTPASPNASGRLRPWICLVVVKNRDGVQLRNVPEKQFRILQISQPADELPDLKDSWAWAHAQVSGPLDNSNTLTEILANSPERTVSRLICPRRLEPNTNYIACVVPVFTEQGPVLKPAWRLDDASLTKLELPVYYSWEFSTGPAGDFQSLVEKLEPRPAPGLGVRDMLVDGEVVTFEGALRISGTTSQGLGSAADQRYRAELRKLVNAPTVAETPQVAPPIYAGHYRNVVKLPEDAPVEWLGELNLDPRYRAIAALGTRVVQMQQEALMASAWEQAGEIERANAILRNAQLLRAASNSVFRHHLNRLSVSSILEVTRPVHGRVIVNAADVTTIEGEIAPSNTPVAVTTSAFRRITRPRGPILRRFLPAERTVRPIVEGIAKGNLSLTMAPIGNILVTGEPFAIDYEKVGVITPELAETQYRNNGAGPRPVQDIPVMFDFVWGAVISAIPGRPHFWISAPKLPGNELPEFTISGQGPDNETAKRFRAAVAAHQPLMATSLLRPPAPPELPVEDLAETVLTKLNPATTVPNLVRPMIEVLDANETAPAEADELAPLQTSPKFPQPMYEGVRDLSQQFVLPGIESVVEDSILLLEPNPRFIEAYMAGLNHEMDRELLWRGYPAHRLNTPFRYFWDTRGRTGGPGEGDIKPLEEWRPDSRLGGNSVGFAKPLPILLIRSELFRRYPTAIVYAVPAVVQGDEEPTLGNDETYPFFQGSFKPDIRFFGFSVTEQALLGNGTQSSPGYFFVIQEHPTEPRFGLDANNASSGHLAPFGDAALTAKKLLQQPVRIAIHARDLLQVQ